jgi:signal transduction histidine kinase
VNLRVPPFISSIRFRLAVTYSVVVFGLGLLGIGAVYYGLSQTLDDNPVSRQLELTTVIGPTGETLTFGRAVEREMVTLEQLVNERALENLRRYSLWAMLGLFPASLVAGWLIADRALRPIGRITAVAKEIQATDLSRRIDLDGPEDELRELADTFDAMLDRVESGVEAQRAFIQDTSHELRNPLAVMATNLDVVLDDPTAGADELRETAHVVRRTVDRATRTVDDLVLFARADVPESARSSVSLREILDDVISEYQGPLEANSLGVEVLGTDVVVDVERSAVKRAVANLVNNAVRLTRTGSTLRVGTGVHDGFAWVGVDDEGPGIDPRDHEAVFQRGWTADDTSIASEGRSGLGLAIARQIASVHRGALTVRSVRGAGAAFVLWLPLEAGSDAAAVTLDGVHPVADPFASPASGGFEFAPQTRPDGLADDAD